MPEPDSARALFDRAMVLPEPERVAFVRAEAGADESLAGRVLRLLDFADDETTTAPRAGAPMTAPLPERVGRYQIRSVLGEGGMGVVYRAAQEAPQREVALKLVRPGLASAQHLRRFELESEVLGRLAHPGIAQIYEAGIDTATGAPFFAMELVEGLPLTRYAEQKKLGTRARLSLFIKVCRAVQHAHAKGIIHRDLKPSNILVAEVGDPPEPQPKVLDFGVARLTDADIEATTQQTDIGQLIGTVPYMSPEQVSGDTGGLDTRSDVYALGVVLFELLAGRLPYALEKRLMLEVVRIIQEEEPSRLSSVNTNFRGDVETIVGKALEKDKDRRYQSASDLATDIERYLGDEPIAARPPSASYQLRKFARRNRVLVGGVAATFVVLVLGIVATTIFAVVADNRRVRAETAETAERERSTQLTAALGRAETAEGEERQRADELEQVAQFQGEQLGGVDPDGMGLAIREGLREKLVALSERRGLGEDETLALLGDHDSMMAGADFTGLALETLETEIFDPALTAIETQFADQPLVKARLLQTIASTMQEAGLLPQAAAPQTEALAIRRRVLGDEHPDTLESITNMGYLLNDQGLYEDAEPLYREAMETCRLVFGDEQPRTLDSISAMGGVIFEQGRFAEAEPLYREALEGQRRMLGDEHPNTLVAINNMGLLLNAQGNYEEAGSFYREAIEARRRVLGDEHPQTLSSIKNMGSLLVNQGKYAAAEPLFREALEVRRRVLGDEHPQTLGSISYLGFLLSAQGNYAEAEPLYREALETQRLVLGHEHPDTLNSISFIGSLLYQQGKYAEAEPYLREALEVERRVGGDEHPRTLRTIRSVGNLLIAQGRYAEAEPLFREALEGRRRLHGDEHPDTLSSISDMGNLLSNQGKYAEAEPYLREALEAQRRVLGDEHQFTLYSIATLGVLLRNQGNYAEAEQLYREAMEVRRRVLGDEHPSTLGSITNLGNLYNTMGRPEDAAKIFEISLPIKRRVLGMQHPWTGYAMTGLADAYEKLGRRDDALPLMLELLGLQTSQADEADADAITLNGAAWTLLTQDIEELNDPEKALGYAKRACTIEEASGGGKLWMYLDTLALALFQTGDVAGAAQSERRAIGLMPEGAGVAMVDELNANLAKYENTLKGESGVADPAQRETADEPVPAGG